MRKLLMAVLLLCSMAAMGQQTEAYKRQLYTDKVAQYKNQRDGGTVLIVLGLVGIGTGIYMYSEGKNEVMSDYGEQMSYGVILLSAGVTAAIAGAILNSNGTRKMNEYQHKLDFGVWIGNDVKGMMLTYKF